MVKILEFQILLVSETKKKKKEKEIFERLNKTHIELFKINLSLPDYIVYRFFVMLQQQNGYDYESKKIKSKLKSQSINF